MMDSGPVQNMYSTLSNKFEKLCISLAFIIRNSELLPSHSLILPLFLELQLKIHFFYSSLVTEGLNSYVQLPIRYFFKRCEVGEWNFGLVKRTSYNSFKPY